MAAAYFRSTLHLSKTVRITDAVLHISHYQPGTYGSAFSQMIFVRHSSGSFFNKSSSENMWDSVTMVSNQGRKRGRASRGKLLRRVNLNIGQKMGHGKTGLIFPGLSTNITGKEKYSDLGLRRKDKSEQDEEETASRIQKPKTMNAVDALDRGYTGRKIAGRKIEPPDPIGDHDFSDFDAYILETKLVGHLTGNQGKVYSQYVIVAVGNRKGLLGMAIGKASTLGAAIAAAKNKAIQRLVYIDISDGHTPLHNFTEKYHRTSVIVKPAPKGSGLHCHQTLKILCKLIGIKDIHVQSEGKVRNYLNLCRAFITGILNTKTHQDIADELGHNIVEYRRENDNYPFLVASPSENAKHSDFKKEDGFTFESYCFGNKVQLDKASSRPWYWRSSHYKKKMSHEYKRRNQSKARVDRMLHGFQPEFKRKQYTGE